MKQIYKIVVTGGPCGGKTTAMSWIQNSFTAMGYDVLFIPESATEIIVAGAPHDKFTVASGLERSIISLQIAKEKIYYDIAQHLRSDKVLIVCDRGVLDCKAFMPDGEFETELSLLGKSFVELRDGYDAVFHLVTAAKGAEKYYTTANNTARTETPAQAAALDDKIIGVWTGHPRLRIIGNDGDFNAKMQKLITEIAYFVCGQTPLLFERRFLVKYPDADMLKNLENCHKIDIVQTYLRYSSEDELRIRKRGENGQYVYYKTFKRKVSDTERIELEERLSKDEYLRLLCDADPEKMQICKTRYCITYKNQYIQLDVFPFWSDKAIAEVRIASEDEKVLLPEWVEVIKDITGDESYKNRSLAASLKNK